MTKRWCKCRLVCASFAYVCQQGDRNDREISTDDGLLEVGDVEDPRYSARVRERSLYAVRWASTVSADFGTCVYKEAEIDI